MKNKSIAIVTLAAVLSVIILSVAVLNRNAATRADAHGETEHVHDFRCVEVFSTCTENGYTKYCCACGYNYIDDVVPAHGHDMVFTGQIDPTQTTPGMRFMRCSICGDRESVELSVQP